MHYTLFQGIRWDNGEPHQVYCEFGCKLVSKLFIAKCTQSLNKPRKITQT